MQEWSRIVCVDWGKDQAKRRAWIADVERRVIGPLDVDTTVAAILAYAAAQPGRTLIGIDAALGIPAAYYDRARASIGAWNEVHDFPSWLVRAIIRPEFQEETRSAQDWRVDRPFIAVPGGSGTLRAFWERAGGSLLREVDAATGAKCIFIVSGFRGTVGCGTRELWKELAPLLDGERSFGLWPFDGSLRAMRGRDVVLAEIYPRVCYALALDPELPAPLKTIAKTKRADRDEAVASLQAAAWTGVLDVRFEKMDRACREEDDFDAMMSAAGLLRCVIEARPLDDESVNVIEGGMLGLASLLPRRGACHRQEGDDLRSLPPKPSNIQVSRRQCLPRPRPRALARCIARFTAAQRCSRVPATAGMPTWDRLVSIRTGTPTYWIRNGGRRSLGPSSPLGSAEIPVLHARCSSRRNDARRSDCCLRRASWHDASGCPSIGSFGRTSNGQPLSSTTSNIPSQPHDRRVAGDSTSTHSRIIGRVND